MLEFTVRADVALEHVEWDLVTPVYSGKFDEYFYNSDEVREFMDYWDITDSSELHLVLCMPEYLSEIAEDHWADELGLEGELPDAVLEALNRLNTAIRQAGPVSWVPGRQCITIQEDKQ